MKRKSAGKMSGPKIICILYTNMYIVETRRGTMSYNVYRDLSIQTRTRYQTRINDENTYICKHTIQKEDREYKRYAA